MIVQNELAIHANEAANLMKELANKNRLMICCCLGNHEMSVGDLNRLVLLSQSALSQHLSRMRDANLVKTRRESQTIFYRLADNNVLKVIDTLKAIYCPD